MDCRGVLLKHNLNSKGWNSYVHAGFPAEFESSNLSRDNVGREIGRMPSLVHFRGTLSAASRGAPEGHRRAETSTHGSKSLVLFCLFVFPLVFDNFCLDLFGRFAFLVFPMVFDLRKATGARRPPPTKVTC